MLCSHFSQRKILSSAADVLGFCPYPLRSQHFHSFCVSLHEDFLWLYEVTVNSRGANSQVKELRPGEPQLISQPTWLQRPHSDSSRRFLVDFGIFFHTRIEKLLIYYSTVIYKYLGLTRKLVYVKHLLYPLKKSCNESEGLIFFKKFKVQRDMDYT